MSLRMSIWCRRLLFVTSALFTACDSSIHGEQVEIERQQRVSSADGSVSILAPKGWFVDTRPRLRGAKLSITSPLESESDPFTELIFINEENLAGYSLDYYFRSFIEQSRQQMSTFEIIDESNVQLNGRSAYKVVIRHNNEYGQILRSIYYFLENNGFAYMVDAIMLNSANQRWEEEMKNICLSFKLQ